MKKTFLSLIVAFMMVISCFMFSGCGKTPESFSITTKTFGTRGTVAGEELILQEGTNTTIIATPNPNEQFLCWLHENKVASFDANYTFTINKETSGEYVAIFKEPDCEFVCISSLTINNGYNNSAENVALLSNLQILIGYNQNELTSVLECTEDMMQEQENTIPMEQLYPENVLPFAFQKTKQLYVKIVLKYMWNEIEYVSEDLRTIEPVAVGTQSNNLELTNLSLAKNTLNPNLTLVGTENSSIALNLESLYNFIPEEPAE